MPQVSTTKFFFVDETLSRKEQADNVSRKILKLNYNLIYACLSYHNIVWASTFPTSLQKILSFISVLLGLQPAYTSSASLFHKLQALTIYDINIFQMFFHV